eukprot:TRINITY_DN72513_c0_g1_i1.p1 TRINITY_DN72513_c0_g1~~TRINITY_DN72513_c0_g1_i1.p1  ORF type:complete len:371 (-),score=51.15 TRINITY_DN72513_c0_g1_i1:115-1227(-)
MGRDFPAPEAHDMASHRDWAMKLWSRMDRDGSGAIDRKELDSDEFQDVLRSVIAPNREGDSTAFYARSEINVPQVIHFCVHKADNNSDGKLQFDEFMSLLLAIRNAGSSQESLAGLIFAMFDLDCDGYLDRNEFLEVYRYFLGHRPTEVQFEEDWAKLDLDGQFHVGPKQYRDWLRRNENQIFKEFRDVVVPESQTEHASSPGKVLKNDAVSVLLASRKPKYRKEWNERFHTDFSTVNATLQPRQKHLFSRTQSEPELKRFYSRRRHFKTQFVRLHAPEPEPYRTMITADMPPLLPSRHIPDGTMRDKAGQRTRWDDCWQTPQGILIKNQPSPGSLSLRCMGQPPDHILKGKDLNKMASPPKSGSSGQRT